MSQRYTLKCSGLTLLAIILMPVAAYIHDWVAIGLLTACAAYDLRITKKEPSHGE